ncbi:MAG TPA: ATP-binding cassette domain-containing protein [Polyangiaceae bacterium]|nr:ATP-binding cassette domain-containing protein [Polyangiaceae bacterium]
MKPLIEALDVTIVTPGGRPLFEGLNLCLGRERVALIGRNGVGKSTLLAALAGDDHGVRGSVKRQSRPHFVPQILGHDRAGRTLSHGERRRRELTRAQRSGAEIVLLDEPTEDLDDAGVAWLRDWLKGFSGCLVVASHDRRLLQDFRHFFLASEAGCRALSGSLAELEAELERDHREGEQRYLRALRRLEAQEEHTAQVARRRERKKRYGRCSELDRATPRIRLNQKRDHAQVYQGKFSRRRAARIAAAREWTRSMRRTLAVDLPLELPLPSLPADEGRDLLCLRGVASEIEGRRLFEALDLRVRRDRVAVVGANGAGKTTLLEIMRGGRRPTAGSVDRDPRRMGSIAQGGADWVLDESLLGYLSVYGGSPSPEALAELLVAHRFPLALGERPLRSLSPGERVRAALICLFQRSPAVELLVLDEPTFSLDLVGQRALTRALRAWPGGLVVASHDRAFLSEIAVNHVIELGTNAA